MTKALKLIYLSTLGGLACWLYSLLLLYLENHIWQPSSLILSLFLYLPLTVNLLSFPIRSKLWQSRYIEETLNEEHGSVPTVFLCHFIFFVFICRGVWLHFGADNFESLPDVVSLYTWLLYGLDNVLGVILLDILELYGISISHVEHAKTFLMSTIILTYRLSLSFGMITLLVGYYGKMIARAQNSVA